jgi:catechol 2,3-dioxygenase-like lactoylglutathione lyase family enzyme
MTAPALSGLHHFKMPVGDLDVSLAWFRRVLGAVHLEDLDHVDSDNARFAAIVKLPGSPLLIELRWAPAAARALRECDLLVLNVDDAAHLDSWVDHLDALEVEHSPVLGGGGGPVVVIVDPDGKFIRLMVAPPGGMESQSLRGKHLDPEGSWLNSAPMRHPRPGSTPTKDGDC